MGMREKFAQSRAARKAAARERNRTPSFREKRARLRTEKAEEKLVDTEAEIHREADRIRRDMGVGS